MPPDAVEHHAPDSLRQAFALLAEHGADAAPFAGGTDLLIALKHGVLQPRHLVSLTRIPGLKRIATTPRGELAIGTLATLREVASSPLVQAASAALAEAAGLAGSPLLRNRGTLGGNVCLDTRCWYYNQTRAWRASRALCEKAGGERCYVNQKENRCVALFAADTPPALIVCGARATLAAAGGERERPVEALYSGDALRPIARAGGEVLTTITIPAPPARWGTAYVKYSARESIDFPVVGVAAAVQLAGDGTIATARVAFTGARTAPFRHAELEAALGGRAVPAEGDPELTSLTARALGALYLIDVVPHKRRVAGLIALAAVARAGLRARQGAAA